MPSTIAETDTLISAYQVLFNPQKPVLPRTLYTLCRDQVKKAYHRQIKHYHPDKTIQTGIPENILNEKFHTFVKAYEVLTEFVDENHSPPKKIFNSDVSIKKDPKSTLKDIYFSLDPPPARPIKPSKIKESFYFTGYVPILPLRFGRYLYYRGIISWPMLVEAIAWQRKNRPSIGQLSCEEKFLSAQDIAMILFYHEYGEPFGYIARALGKLSREQINFLLKKQNHFHCKLGQFFLKNRILSESQLHELLHDLKIHNRNLGYENLMPGF